MSVTEQTASWFDMINAVTILIPHCRLECDMLNSGLLFVRYFILFMLVHLFIYTITIPIQFVHYLFPTTQPAWKTLSLTHADAN